MAPHFWTALRTDYASAARPTPWDTEPEWGDRV